MRVEYERRRTPVPILDAPVVALTLAVTLAFLMFVLIEPTPGWIALAGAVAAAAGTDRVLRFARPRPVELGIDPTPQVLLPALYALAAPVMVEGAGLVDAPRGARRRSWRGAGGRSSRRSAPDWASGRSCWRRRTRSAPMSSG